MMTLPIPSFFALLIAISIHFEACTVPIPFFASIKASDELSFIISYSALILTSLFLILL